MRNNKNDARSAVNAELISRLASLVLPFGAMFATWAFLAKLLLGHF